MATYNELERSVQSGSSWTGLESGGLPRLQKAVHNEPDDDCDTESRYGRSRNQRNQWGWNGWRTQFYCGHRTPEVREDDFCVVTAGRVGNRIETRDRWRQGGQIRARAQGELDRQNQVPRD